MPACLPARHCHCRCLQVSGALSVGSVALTAATAVPLFLFGVTALGLNSLSFLNTVTTSYTSEVSGGHRIRYSTIAP